MDRSAFDYSTAFSRSIGWVTADEQLRLRGARVAIAGMGGVGGAHLLTLCRMGIGRFSLADFDTFELHNFNRQVGANMATIGREKAAVLAEMALSINPELDIRHFTEPVSEGNIDAFLEGVDVYVDALDFFALAARRLVFEACYRKGIPALTAAPLGMGVAFLRFSPGGMSFESYFRLEGHSEGEQYARFIAGLSPAMLQRPYLVEPAAVNFAEHRGPSTGMACELCAGVMGVEVLKDVLGRGERLSAPRAFQFDAYRQRYTRTWRPFGNANPLQRLLVALIRPHLSPR